MKQVFVFFLVVLTLLAMAPASAASRVWDFAVLLDGSRIGSHTFRVTDESGTRQVRSDARFDVRFLFINAFRYRHSNTETWRDNCLVELDSSTNANGKKFEVSGERTDTGFVIETGRTADALPECVMTFAYWNPHFLKQSRLLNPQSGEYLDVEVSRLPSQDIDVRGERVAASVYNVSAKGMELKLWYSQQGDWLALESLAKGGRVIRYELT